MKDGIGLFTKKDGGKLSVEFYKDHVIARYDYKGEGAQLFNPKGIDDFNKYYNLIKKKNEFVNNVIVETISNNVKKMNKIKNIKFI